MKQNVKCTKNRIEDVDISWKMWYYMSINH